MIADLLNSEVLAGIPNCPGVDKGRDGIAFRFVHAELSHKNNFLPVALINPLRKLPEDEKRCAFYALSFYETREQAISDFHSIKKVAKNFAKQVGGCIAEVTLKTIDGVATQTDHRGHFDLFPTNKANFTSQSRWLGTIEE